MALPDVTFHINSNDDYCYDYLVTLDMTDVGGDCQEMRFSNNGLTWSPWFIFATSHSWDLRLYGGSNAHGLEFVFAEFKNADGTTSVTDSILLVEVSPKIEYGDDPSQRSDEVLVDIPYKGIEQYPVGQAIDLIEIEYDVYGAFTGQEKTMSLKESDAAFTGVTGLQFSPTGFDHNLVWDVLSDVDTDQYWATTKVRIKAHYGKYTSDWFVSESFIIDTRVTEDEDSEGKRIPAGDDVKIEFQLYDSNMEAVDADSTPEITSIVDPDGTEHVTVPLVMTNDGTGYYYYNYSTDIDDPTGQWVAKISYVYSGETYEQQFLFYLTDESHRAVVPGSDDSCKVYGTLYCENGQPMEDTVVLIFNDDLTDPGHFNPTRIGVVPVSATTDSNGYFEVDVIRNSEVIIYIKDMNYRRRAKIPDQISVEFTDMILNLPTPPRDQFGNRT